MGIEVFWFYGELIVKITHNIELKKKDIEVSNFKDHFFCEIQ
jgi:hypothetical protein